MYLKRLEIYGFKTFAERTVLEFTPGITAILGPNGSGKSNLADAIVWVLGEGNVRSLRGVTSQDVIFAGNERRRPLNVAEVILTVDNSDGRLPLPFAEVTVARRLYRSGESEFFINRAPCRLKDLYELFLDTGISRDGYGLMHQGEVDQLLSLRAEERRAVFEEAAGIKKFRVRKREAERKLEATHANLLRVADILGELEQQRAPLERQAQAARRYRELAGRLRLLEEAWYGARLRALAERATQLAAEEWSLAGERERLATELAALREHEATLRRELAAVERQIESARAEHTEAMAQSAAALAEAARAEERAAEASRRADALEREQALAELRLATMRDEVATAAAEAAERERELTEHARQVAEATRAAERARAELTAALRAREAEQRRALERARREAERAAHQQALAERATRHAAALAAARRSLAEADAEVRRAATACAERRAEAATAAESAATARERLATAEAAWREAEAALRSAEAASRRARSEHDQALARLEALAALGDPDLDPDRGAADLLAAAEAGALPGRWQRLLDGIVAPPSLERAVAAALGPYARALVTDSDEAWRAARAWLAERGEGAILIGPEGLPPPLPGSLAEQIAIPSAAIAGRAAQAILGRAFLVADLDTIPAAAPADGCWIAVTTRGDWRVGFGAVGVAGAEAGDPATAALARRREREALAERLVALAAAVAEQDRALVAAREQAEAARAALRSAQVEAEAARLAAHHAKEAVARAERDEQQAGRRRQAAADRLAELEREAERIRQAQAALATEPPTSPVEGDLPAIEPLEAAVRAAEQAAADARVAYAAAESQRAAARARAEERRRALAEAETAYRLATEELATLRDEAECLRRDAVDLSERAAALTERAERAASASQDAAERRQRLTAELERAAAAASSAAERLRQVDETTHRIALERATVEAERRHLQSQWDEVRLLDDADPLAGRLDPEAVAAALAEVRDPEAELQRLRRQIRSLGPVNLEAEAQYAALVERLEFLHREKADLEQASTQLRAAIQELDAASRLAFQESFRQIASAFDAMFRLLFDGGRAELRLTEADDVLEAGVEIYVQPPGKKVQHLSLLSGGERALTAAAMLFALLTVRPSPFCVLDEVDAALDETNVERFGRVLRRFAERTQFVLITHNRGTMEVADTLYGVTMEERGVSRVLSCRLEQVEAMEEGRALEPSEGTQFAAPNGAEGNGHREAVIARGSGVGAIER